MRFMFISFGAVVFALLCIWFISSLSSEKSSEYKYIKNIKINDKTELIIKWND